jgi:hypothetical protein
MDNDMLFDLVPSFYGCKKIKPNPQIELLKVHIQQSNLRLDSSGTNIDAKHQIVQNMLREAGLSDSADTPSYSIAFRLKNDLEACMEVIDSLFAKQLDTPAEAWSKEAVALFEKLMIVLDRIRLFNRIVVFYETIAV